MNQYDINSQQPSYKDALSRYFGINIHSIPNTLIEINAVSLNISNKISDYINWYDYSTSSIIYDIALSMNFKWYVLIIKFFTGNILVETRRHFV